VRDLGSASCGSHGKVAQVEDFPRAGHVHVRALGHSSNFSINKGPVVFGLTLESDGAFFRF